MPQLDEYLRQLAPAMTQWRRDFHLHAESGWLEFRTASKVAEILDGLGYQLALGRDVIDADSRSYKSPTELKTILSTLKGYIQWLFMVVQVLQIKLETLNAEPKLLWLHRVECKT